MMMKKLRNVSQEAGIGGFCGSHIPNSIGCECAGALHGVPFVESDPGLSAAAGPYVMSRPITTIPATA
jgi:hypothetical protein